MLKCFFFFGWVVLGVLVMPAVGSIFFPKMGEPVSSSCNEKEKESKQRGNDGTYRSSLLIDAGAVFLGEEGESNE
ncbi:MAG: hypothetical protein CBE26_00545 [Kiritimatiellaceae bacterium TMED266]|nr:MAG: hypothetical protein CBE26_00545 [Kiritimatiellaceae bacterium TMED266]